MHDIWSWNIPLMGEGRVLAEPPQPQAALQRSAQILRLVMLLLPFRQCPTHLQAMRLQAC